MEINDPITKDKIDGLSNREVDELIAVSYFGWYRIPGDTDGLLTPPDNRRALSVENDEDGRPEYLEHFSVSITDAWKLVALLASDNWFGCGTLVGMEDGNNFWAEFEPTAELREYTGLAPDMPLAICRAALYRFYKIQEPEESREEISERKSLNEEAKRNYPNVENIFSGDYSIDMWDSINSAETVEQLRSALYHVCCRLQNFESRMNKRTDNVTSAGDAPAANGAA